MTEPSKEAVEAVKRTDRYRYNPYVQDGDLRAHLSIALAVERERWEKETRERFHSKEIMTGLWGGEYGQEDHDVVNETLDAIFDKGEG